MDEGAVIYEALEPSADQAQVMEILEVMQQSLNEANVRLEQLHADVSLVFLGVVLVVGVILGCAVSFMLIKMWRS